MPFSSPIKSYRHWLLIIVVSLVAFFESAIPYIYAEKHTPAGYHFLGQVAYMPDQNMYFSFISQARDGAFILNNKLTYIPNKPVFVNLEFWLTGSVQRITGLSENAIYQLWRYWGALLLTIGVYMLASIVFTERRRRLWALLLLLFSGGFGFVFALLSAAHFIGFNATQMGIIDMRYGLLPFQQMVTNPHFSFPHGLILIAYACFLLGERDNKTIHYFISGLLFMLIGLIRPYDIIPPVVIFPLWVFMNRRQQIDFKVLGSKFLPLFMILPVFIYNVWLFKFNDIFKYWAQQGLNAGSMPAPYWHYLAYGVIGVLAIMRLLQKKTERSNQYDKFLVLWFCVTFIFIHLGKIIPAIGWSPQIGVYLAVPLALLGCSMEFKNSRRAYGVIGVIALLAIAGNISIVLYFTKNFRDPAKTDIYYAKNEEVAAWQWLKANAQKGNVVLATETTSQRIAKYTSASVAAAHYSVTPKFAETEGMVSGIFANSHISMAQKSQLEQLNADYIYIGPLERKWHNVVVDTSAYLSAVYANPLVTIYKVNRLK